MVTDSSGNGPPQKPHIPHIPVVVHSVGGNCYVHGKRTSRLLQQRHHRLFKHSKFLTLQCTPRFARETGIVMVHETEGDHY